jgi:hypothetical protein
MPALLRDRLAGFCAASGIAESTVISASVEQYLDGTSDSTLLLRRLDRLGRAVDRIHRDEQLFAEAFSVFVRIWFAHTPPIGDAEKEDARAGAESRYERFVRHVLQQFAAGSRFFDELSQETVGLSEGPDGGSVARARRAT